MRFIEDLDVKGKTVFLRVDFNVPLNDDGDDPQRQAHQGLPADDHATSWSQGAKLVLASHLGRPKGKPDPKMSLRPGGRAPGRAASAGTSSWRPTSSGPRSTRSKPRSSEGQALLLENVRFHPAKTKNDPGFVQGPGRGHRHLRQRRLRLQPPGPRLGRRHRRFRPGRGRRLPDEEGSRLPAQGRRQPGQALRGHPRRGQDRGQDPGHRDPPGQGRHHPHRRGHGLHVLPGPGHAASASRSSRPTRSRSPRTSWTRPRTKGVGFLLPVGPPAGQAASSPAPSTRIVETLPFPGRPDGRRHRPQDRSPPTPAVIAKAKTIFWNGPLGVFEIDGLRPGHDRDRRGRGRLGRRLDRRRRRFHRRRRQGRRQRQDHPHLHGRRGQPRIRRQRDPARDRSPGKEDGRHAPRRPVRRRQLEDEHDPSARPRALAGAIVEAASGPAPSRRSSSCPPFTALAEVARGLAGSAVGLGAQNLHLGGPRAPSPARSPAPMLDDAGCRYVVVGHSERRQLFGETDETVEPQGPGRPQGRACGPSSASAKSLEEREAGRTMERRRRPARRRAWPASPPTSFGRIDPGLRARLGHRHGADGHPGPGRGGPRLHPGPPGRKAMEKRPPIVL